MRLTTNTRQRNPPQWTLSSAPDARRGAPGQVPPESPETPTGEHLLTRGQRINRNPSEHLALREPDESPKGWETGRKKALASRYCKTLLPRFYGPPPWP